MDKKVKPYKKGDLVNCGCVGCKTKINATQDGDAQLICTECSKGEAHRHDLIGKYIPVEPKQKHAKRVREPYFVQNG